MWKDIVDVIREIMGYHSDPMFVKAGTKLLSFYSLLNDGRSLARHYLILAVNRRFIITQDGYMGLGPLAMEEDDVVVLFGGVVVYILRPCEDTYAFIGELVSCRAKSLPACKKKETWSHERNALS